MMRRFHRRRGIGAVNASCPDDYGNDPCAALQSEISSGSLPSAAQLSAALGLPTSWLTTPVSWLGGIPGWAALALGSVALFMVSAIPGGRRR
jgi:hypothetical protein